MGAALNSNDDSSKLKAIKDNFKVVRQINDPRYGEGKLLQPKTRGDQVVMKEINLTDEIQYKRWQKKLETRKSAENDNIIKIINTHSVHENQMCSQMYKVYILFEYIPDSLQVRIDYKKESNSHFSQDEMMTLINCAVNGLRTFQLHQISHQNIRTQTLSILGDQRNLCLKICDTPLLTSMTAFGAVLQDYSGHLKGYYLSPILVKAVFANNFQPTHNAFKSDVFSLGMSLLSAALLQPCDMCYLYNVGEVNEHEVEAMLQSVQQLYSKPLVDIFREMLKFKEAERPDFLEMEEYLSNRAQPKDTIDIVSRVKEYQQYEQEAKTQDQALNYLIQAGPFEDNNSHYNENGNDNQIQNKMKPSRQMQMDVPNLLKPDVEDQINQQKVPQETSSQVSINDIIQGQVAFKSNDTQILSRINTSKNESQQNSPNPNKIDNRSSTHQSKSNFIVTTSSRVTKQPISPKVEHQIKQTNYQIQEPMNQYQSKEVDLIAQYEAKYKTKISSKIDTIPIQQYKPYESTQSFIPQMIKNDTFKYDTFKYDNNPIISDSKYTFAENQIQFSQPNNNYQSYKPYENTDLPRLQTTSQDYIRNSFKLYDPTTTYQNRESDYKGQINPINSYDTRSQQNTRFQDPLRQSYQPEYQPQANYYDLSVNRQSYKQQQVPNQVKNGYARIDFPQGGHYEGNLKDNKMSGFGTNIQNNQIGTLYYTNGSPAYEGQWFDNKFQGQGTLNNEAPDNFGSIDYSNLDSIGNQWRKYVGEFSDDSKNGQGTMYLMNGDKFEGTFKNDLVNGVGTYFRNSGQTIKGLWQNNQLRQ